MPGITFDLELLRLGRRFRASNALQLPGFRAIDELCQFGAGISFLGMVPSLPGVRALFRNSSKWSLLWAVARW
jgi:hypothetical protein